ncbi:MAG: hypothetical protein JNG90_00870 [Planctomycetaceae bacterium]|nr:hypothetical protein [Planctomycetaceae bacterium]
MAGHTFRLASLLRLREARRDDCRLALAAALRADERLESHLAETNLELAQLRTAGQQALQPGVLNLDQLCDQQRDAASARARHSELERQRSALALEIDQLRAALVEADTEVRALEKLREAGEARHAAELERAAALDLDEAALRQVRSSAT